MKEKLRLYSWLAGTNLFISAFTFGGGYIVVPMIRKYFVQKKQLFDEPELVEMAAIAQSTPGAIAINIAALAGYRTAGNIGLFISCVCAVIPPLVILSVVSVCYSAVISNAAVAAVLKGMQAGVAALIVDFVIDMMDMIRKERSWFANLLVFLAFGVSFFTTVNVIFVLLTACGVCILRVWLRNKNQTAKDTGVTSHRKEQC